MILNYLLSRRILTFDLFLFNHFTLMWHCDLVNDHIFKELTYLEELNQIFQTILPLHRIFFILPCIRMLLLVFMCLVVEQFDLSDLFFLRFDKDLRGFNEFMTL